MYNNIASPFLSFFKGLSECTMQDVIPLTSADDTADIKKLNPYFTLCWKDAKRCVLCLVIETELYIPPVKEVEDEGHSGADEEDYSEDMRNVKGRRMVNPDQTPLCFFYYVVVTQYNITSRSSLDSYPSFRSEVLRSVLLTSSQDETQTTP